MDFTTLGQRIADAFPGLSPQLQRAAQHVMQHPDDVALMSMRRLATAAGVHPSTMVRLARVFDFRSFTDFRDTFQQRLRLRPMSYLDRARSLQARSGSEERAVQLLKELLSTHGANLQECFASNTAEQFIACARTLNQARRVYIVALRSCFPVGFFFHYVCGMYRGTSVLLDGLGGTFGDDLRTLGPGDVMFAISMHPYSQSAVKAVEYAKRLGGKAVVLTDSLVSPLAKSADHMLLISKESPSFFHSIAPAMAVVEALVLLMVAEGGDAALKAIAETERRLENFDAYWHRVSRDRPSVGGRKGEVA